MSIQRLNRPAENRLIAAIDELVQALQTIPGAMDSDRPAALTDTQLRAAPLRTSVTNWPVVQAESISNWPQTQAVSGPLTNAELRAVPIPTSISNWPQTQAVSGPLTDAELRAVPISTSISNWPQLQAVSGPLTDAELRAVPIPTSISNWPQTQAVSGPLTNTQLRATPVPASISNWPQVQVVSGPLTNTELRAAPMPISSYREDVALGARPGRTLVMVVGHNTSTGNGTELIVPWGGAAPPNTSADTLRIVSSSRDDAPNGTGLRRIRVQGVDADWNLQTAVYDLNGATPVTSVERWAGINSVVPVASGSACVNAGKVDLLASGSNRTMAQIPAGCGCAKQLLFHVPLRHRMVIDRVCLGALPKDGRGDGVTMCLVSLDVDTNSVRELCRTVVASGREHTSEPVFVINHRTAVYVMAIGLSRETSVWGCIGGIMVEGE